MKELTSVLGVTFLRPGKMHGVACAALTEWPVRRTPPRVFPDPKDLDKIRPGLQDALDAEIKTIVAKIPNEDLAIQWDCATEVQDAYGAIKGFSKETAIVRNVGQIAAISPKIPEKVMLGFHLCFGTLGGWPRFAPDDLGETVELANAFVEAAGPPRGLGSHPRARGGIREVFRTVEKSEPEGRQGLSRARTSYGHVATTPRLGSKISA